MLIHELNILSSNPNGLGWDELYDTTTTVGYTYYGLAQWSNRTTKPSQSANVWQIIIFNNTTQAITYFPANQTWSARASLTLP